MDAEIKNTLKRMLGKKMTKEEQEFLEELRTKVRNGEISLADAHKIWDEKILHRYYPDWHYDNLKRD